MAQPPRALRRHSASAFLRVQSARELKRLLSYAAPPIRREALALLGVACPRYELAILLGAEAGLRQDEIGALQWADIGSGLLKVNRRFDRRTGSTRPKGNKPRKVGISPRIRRALAKVRRVLAKVERMKHRRSGS